MDEYIKKSDVIDWFSPYNHIDEPIPFETLAYDIRSMKPADVVKVVQCKDCRRAEKDHLFGGYWCHGYRVSPDGFCSYGERKEGVEDV